MKTLALVALFASLTGYAYQVTGPVVEVTDSKIIVQKGKEKWEIEKTGSTKTDEVKVGDKVTVDYTMSASTITAKADKKSKKK